MLQGEGNAPHPDWGIGYIGVYICQKCNNVHLRPELYTILEDKHQYLFVGENLRLRGVNCDIMPT